MKIELETVTGRLIDLENPDPSTIDIEDIAWGLSRMPRFCGHTITVLAFNIAQHSMFVADETKRFLESPSLVKHLAIDEVVWSCWAISQDTRNSIILKALLHDAAEVYTGDLPSPLKRIPELTQVIKTIENKLMAAIYTALNVPPPTKEEELLIKYADKVAQKIEAYQFMTSRGKHWQGLPDVSLEDLQQFDAPLDALTSYKMFLEKFQQLTSHW
jgi:5'-deoxynucleotidase YfbR-like HD superfamily hydrolase